MNLNKKVKIISLISLALITIMQAALVYISLQALKKTDNITLIYEYFFIIFVSGHAAVYALYVINRIRKEKE